MPLIVDPALQEKEIRIDVPLKKYVVLDVIEVLARAAGLEWDILYGLVIFAEPERLYGQIAGKAMQGPEGAIEFDFYQATPAEILQYAGREGDFEVRVDPGAKMAEAGPINARFENVLIRNVIAFLAAAYGDTVEWSKEGGLLVK